MALARALVRQPDAYLLDEPLSNLDAGTRVEMRTELRRLHREVGATMVHVTHDQVEALTLADRVAVMDAGRVRQVGPPDEVYRGPRNRFVAAFLGTPRMNFLAPDARARSCRCREGTTLGIRPEDVQLGGGWRSGARRARRGRGRRRVRPPRRRSRRPRRGRRPPGAGDEVASAFARERAHLFDAETGSAVVGLSTTDSSL